MTEINEPSILRALRIETRQDERGRLLETIDALRINALAHATDFSRRPGLTGWGRRAAALQWLLDELAHANPYAVEPGAPEVYVLGDIDAVEIYRYDPADEPEDMPVRLVVNDGGDDVVATAYLTLDDAERLFTEGLALIERIRTDRAARTEAGESR